MDAEIKLDWSTDSRGCPAWLDSKQRRDCNPQIFLLQQRGPTSDAAVLQPGY